MEINHSRLISNSVGALTGLMVSTAIVGKSLSAEYPAELSRELLNMILSKVTGVDETIISLKDICALELGFTASDNSLFLCDKFLSIGPVILPLTILSGAALGFAAKKATEFALKRFSQAQTQQPMLNSVRV